MLISRIRNNRGFTLVEVVIVVLLISIIALTVSPRISIFLSSRQKNLALLVNVFAKTYDDAFLNNRTNIVFINLENPGSGDHAEYDRNTISVMIAGRHGLREHPRENLRKIDFGYGLNIIKAIFPGEQETVSGTARLTFYQGKCSSDCILHLRAGDEDWSLKIYRYLRDPEVIEGHVKF